MGYGIVKVNSESVNNVELAQMLLALPENTKITEFVYRSATENGFTVEHPSIEDGTVFDLDFVRQSWIENGHLKVANEFKGLRRSK